MFGGVLQELRKDRGWKQSDLANKNNWGNGMALGGILFPLSSYFAQKSFWIKVSGMVSYYSDKDKERGLF